MIFGERTSNKSIPAPQTTTKSISSLQRNQAKFDPLRWHQLDLDRAIKVRVVLDANTKTSDFRSEVKNQGSFDHLHNNKTNSHPYSEVKSFSFPTIKQVNFDAATLKTKLISIPTLNPGLFRRTQ